MGKITVIRKFQKGLSKRQKFSIVILGTAIWLGLIMLIGYLNITEGDRKKSSFSSAHYRPSDYLVKDGQINADFHGSFFINFKFWFK